MDVQKYQNKILEIKKLTEKFGEFGEEDIQKYQIKKRGKESLKYVAMIILGVIIATFAVIQLFLK